MHFQRQTPLPLPAPLPISRLLSIYTICFYVNVGWDRVDGWAANRFGQYASLCDRHLGLTGRRYIIYYGCVLCCS